MRKHGLTRVATLVGALLLAALPLAFASGGKEGAGGAGKSFQDLKGSKITVLTVEMPMLKAYWKMIPEFEKKYGIKVEVDESPFDQNREKTLLDMSKHTGRYDIFNVDCMWLAEYAAAGYLEPLMKYIKNPALTEADFDVADFVPRIFSGNGVWEDVVYTIPMGSGTMGQSWRTDIAAEYGLSFPTKWEEWTTDKMLDYAKKLNHPEKGYNGYVTQPRRWDWGWTFIQLMMTFTSPARIGDEYLGKDWKVTINNPDNLAAMKWYLSLRPYLPAGHANFGYDEVATTYQQGRAAGAVNYSEWIINHYEDPSVSKAAGKSVHLHTPVGPGGRIDPFFGSWGISVSADSRNKEAAWVFIQWITSKTTQTNAIASGGDPVRHSTYKSDATKKYMPWYVPLYDFYMKYTNPDERVRIPEWAEISEIMGLYGNKTWLDEITPEEALKTMEQEMTKTMEKGGYYNVSFKKPAQNWRDLTYYDRSPDKWK
jgi:multiple sugar transport system substrate-binding protein